MCEDRMGDSKLLFELIVFLNSCGWRCEVSVWVIGKSFGCIGLVSEWVM